MVAAVRQFVAGRRLQGLEGFVVGGVVGLDDLEGPVSGDDVAAEDLPPHPVGPSVVPRRAQQLHRLVEFEVRGAGELVQRVEVAAGPFGRLQCLGQGAQGFHGGVRDPVGAPVGAVRAVVVRVRGSHGFHPCHRDGAGTRAVG